MSSLIRTARLGLFLILIICLGCTSKEPTQTNDLPLSTPEAEGVSSAGILQFVEALDQGDNEIHSFVVVRHGKIISEGWWNPYGKELRHVMFSVSKSFTSMGVGLAIAENKLSLTDKVASFFPESLLVSKVSGKRMAITQNDLGITAVRVQMQETEARIEFERDTIRYEVIAGLDNWKMSETPLTTLNAAPRADQVQPVKLAATCTWIDASTFQLSARFVEEAIGSEVWLFRFNETPEEVSAQIEVKPIPADMPFGRPVVVLQGTVE